MKVTAKRAAELAGFCRIELARTDLNPDRRRMLEEKLGFYQRVLKDRCCRCGQTLTDPVSQARGFGPECAHKVDPREFVTEQETVESLARDYGDDITRQRRDHEVSCLVCHRKTWRLDAVCEDCTDAGVSVRRGA